METDNNIEKRAHNLIIRKTRGSGEILATALRFLSAEARELVKALGIYAAPFLIVGLAISYAVSYGEPSIEKIYFLKDSTTKNQFVFMLISMVFFVAGLCMTTLVIIKTLLTRSVENEGQVVQTPTITISLLIEQLKTFVVNFIIVYVLYTAAFYLIRESEKYNFLADDGYSPDILTYIVNVFIALLPMIIFFPPVIFIASCTLFVSVRDNLGATEAMNSVLKISREKLGKMYGGSFIICLVTVLIQLLFQFLFQYFGMVIGFFGLSSSSFIYAIVLNKVILLALLIFAQVASVLLYGSIEDELEGYYMKSKIEQV